MPYRKPLPETEESQAALRELEALGEQRKIAEALYDYINGLAIRRCMQLIGDDILQDTVAAKAAGFSPRVSARWKGGVGLQSFEKLKERIERGEIDEARLQALAKLLTIEELPSQDIKEEPNEH